GGAPRRLMILGLSLCLSTAVWPLSISPARTDVRLARGEKIKHEFTVVNTHAEAYNVEVSAKSWYVLPENKNISVQDWIELKGKKNFRLKPGETRKVEVVIHCPQAAVG